MKKMILKALAALMLSATTAFAGTSHKHQPAPHHHYVHAIKHVVSKKYDKHTLHASKHVSKVHNLEASLKKVIVKVTTPKLVTASQLTKDLCYGTRNDPSQVNALKVSLQKLHYLPSDSRFLNGKYDRILLCALDSYQTSHNIKAHGYYVTGSTRISLQNALKGYSGVINAAITAPQAEVHQGWFARMFGNSERTITNVNVFARKTYYDCYEHVAHTVWKKQKGHLVKKTVIVSTSDPDTDGLRTAVGSHLRYSSSVRAGTVAVDPELCEFGSLVKVTEGGKVHAYIADDRGGAVVHKTASQGKTQVFDFFSHEAPTSDYGTVQIIPYVGKPVQQMTSREKENLHNLNYWSHGYYQPTMLIAQR